MQRYKILWVNFDFDLVRGRISEVGEFEQAKSSLIVNLVSGIWDGCEQELLPAVSSVLHEA